MRVRCDRRADSVWLMAGTSPSSPCVTGAVVVSALQCGVWLLTCCATHKTMPQYTVKRGRAPRGSHEAFGHGLDLDHGFDYMSRSLVRELAVHAA